MTTVSLDALRLFSVVAQEQSFTNAAAKLGQDKAQVSRTVRRLEVVLKAALLHRTTRSVKATAEGAALLRKLSPLLAQLEQVTAEVPERVEVPEGEVSLTTTPDLGRALLAPALATFRARYPAVRVRVTLSNSVVDLMAADVDLALRVGRPGGGSLIARKVGELTAGFFAAPSYLARHGTPTRVEQLADHERLWPSPPKGQRSFASALTPSPASVTCADFGFLAELARAGGGIALLPTFLGTADRALVRVLPDFALGGAPVFLVSRPTKPQPPRIAALRAHLLSALTW